MTSLLTLPAALLLAVVVAVRAVRGEYEPDAVHMLVQRYAPLLYLHPRERWLPDDVATFLRHVQVQDEHGRQHALVNGSLPTGPSSEHYHIVASVPQGLGTPAVQYAPFLGGGGATAPVYVTVTRCGASFHTNSVELPAGGNRPSFTATYWTFHPFSQGKEFGDRLRGSHVGDWEHVSINVKDGELSELYVSSHNFGAYYTYCHHTKAFNFSSQDSRERFAWMMDMKPSYPPHIRMNGTHPVLYVARGSHGLWPTPGEHVYNPTLRLSDFTARGAAWRTWRHLVLLWRAQPRWLQYRGRWGNQADCWMPVSALCRTATGPPGIARRPQHFQCRKPAGSRGRQAQQQRSWWRRLFGVRRRRKREADDRRY